MGRIVSMLGHSEQMGGHFEGVFVAPQNTASTRITTAPGQTQRSGVGRCEAVDKSESVYSNVGYALFVARECYSDQTTNNECQYCILIRRAFCLGSFKLLACKFHSVDLSFTV